MFGSNPGSTGSNTGSNPGNSTGNKSVNSTGSNTGNKSGRDSGNSKDVNNEKVLIIPEIDNKDLKEGKKKHSSDEIHKLIAGKEGQFGCIIS